MTFSSDADNIRQESQQQVQVPDITNRPVRSTPPAANEQERREEIRKRLEQLRERLRTNGYPVIVSARTAMSANDTVNVAMGQCKRRINR